MFLKQVELRKLEVLLIMGGPNSEVWKTVQGYLKHWKGTLPRMYKIWHYTYRFRSDEQWESVFTSALEKVVDNHPNLAGVIRLLRSHEESLRQSSNTLPSVSHQRIPTVGQFGLEGPMRQCDAIRGLIRKNGLNRAVVVAALASGLQNGQIRWNQNSHNWPSLQYANALYDNYVGRGRL